MNKKVFVDICLATYNGERWIDEFLNSLDSQTYANWRLIVSDDASTDQTLEIIKSRYEAINEKLVVVPRERVSVGVVQNFQDAINASKAEYILLADQDDVWHPEKIGLLLELMHETEGREKNPSLVFSDLEVVDERLHTLDRSWWSYTSIKPGWVNSFNVMLLQNIVPGCAMMINRSLINVAMPMPKGVVMHDWWFVLAALAFGHIAYSPYQLVQYRRHTAAHTYWGSGGFLEKLSRQYQGIGVVRADYSKTVIQAQAFQHLIMNNSSCKKDVANVLDSVTAYLMAAKKGWFLKRILLIRSRMHLISFVQTLKFYLYI